MGKVKWSTVSFSMPFGTDLAMVVGHPGLEPGTSVLSGLRSNQLS